MLNSRLSLVHFFSRSTLRKEITLVLILKIMLLCLLWGICFWRPASEPMSSHDMSQRFVTLEIR